MSRGLGDVYKRQIHAREILRVRERLNDILKKHTGQDLATIETDTERDRFMEAEEAMKYGLIDKVISDRIKPEEN